MVEGTKLVDVMISGTNIYNECEKQPTRTLQSGVHMSYLCFYGFYKCTLFSPIVPKRHV